MIVWFKESGVFKRAKSVLACVITILLNTNAQHLTIDAFDREHSVRVALSKAFVAPARTIPSIPNSGRRNRLAILINHLSIKANRHLPLKPWIEVLHASPPRPPRVALSLVFSLCRNLVN